MNWTNIAIGFAVGCVSGVLGWAVMDMVRSSWARHINKKNGWRSY